MFVLLTTALTEEWTITSTEGALRLPTTYDNHPIHPTQSHPHIAVKTTSALKMYTNQSNQPINDYQ